jgi:DNA-directed RNA polymerase
MRVNQRYLAVTKLRYNSNLYKGSKPITIQIPLDKLDLKRQRNGVMPNFIHSLDASVIALMVNKFLTDDNICLFTVHDCFATTADKVELMSLLVREAFIGIYADNSYINKLHDLLIMYIRSHYEVIQNDEKFSVISAGKYYEIPDKVDINEDDLPL